MNKLKFERILIVGAGTAGQQLGIQFLRYGSSVVIYNVDPQQLMNSRSQEDQIMQEWVAEGVHHLLEEFFSDGVEDEVVIASSKELGMERLATNATTAQGAR